LANDALVKTALINLLENACKFSPDHHAQINLNVSDDQFIAIAIKDSAPRIPNEEREADIQAVLQEQCNE
jgi:K+-sensing histidine kinase KdpD